MIFRKLTMIFSTFAWGTAGVRKVIVENAWREIKLRRPDATFTIVGRNPTPAVTRLTGVDRNLS